MALDEKLEAQRAIRLIDEAIGARSVEALILISKLAGAPKSEANAAARGEACLKLGEAIWRWAPAHPEQAKRFAQELAESPGRTNAEASMAGQAYLAAVIGEKRGFPFTALAETADEYDDEGGTVEVSSVSTRIDKKWSFPSATVAQCAEDAFYEAMHLCGIEGQDGAHDGVEVTLRASHSQRFAPTLNPMDANWARVGASAEAAGSRAAIEASTAPAAAKAAGPKGL